MMSSAHTRPRWRRCRLSIKSGLDQDRSELPLVGRVGRPHVALSFEPRVAGDVVAATDGHWRRLEPKLRLNQFGSGR